MSPQKKTHKRKKPARVSAGDRRVARRLHAWSFLILFVLLGAVTISLFVFSRSFVIQEIRVFGETDVAGRVERYIDQEFLPVLDMSAPFARSYRDRHMFFVDKDALIAATADAFPELRSIDVDRELPRTIIVTLERHDIIMVACRDGARTRDACALIDEDGIVGKRVDPESVLTQTNPTQYFTYTGRRLTRGDRLFADGVIASVRTFVREMPFEAGVRSVHDIQIIARGESSLRLTTDAGWDVVIDGSRDPRLSLLVLREFVAEVRDTDNYQDLREVDLRIKNRVFYR